MSFTKMIRVGSIEKKNRNISENEVTTVEQPEVDKTTEVDGEATGVERPGRQHRSTAQWVRKYFSQGRTLRREEREDANLPWYMRFLKQRRLHAILIPFIFMEIIWWSCAIKYSFWGLFPERYFMTVTMVFGSLIAGMTSEGGASVAFPVMTLAFGIKPSIARDFSLMIQSFGMTAAAFTILWIRVVIEWHAIVFCSLGSVFGIIIGLQYIDPNLTPAQKKMGFVSVWFSFAFALFLLNRHYKRRTFPVIPDFKLWKAIVLLLTGFVGGIFSAISGSGVDICSFSVLTLLFRVTEKTATPTSVVVMAGNTMVGFYWRQVMMEAIDIEAYYYLAVCVPVVVLGAPLGSLIGSHFHRLVLAALVYMTDTVALVTAFAIVPQTPYLIGTSITIVLCGFGFFASLSHAGQRLMGSLPQTNREVVDADSFQDTNV